MLHIKISGLNKADTILALMRVLRKHYPKVQFETSKPNFLRTIEIALKGPNEEAFASDLQAFCAELGWKIEIR